MATRDNRLRRGRGTQVSMSALPGGSRGTTGDRAQQAARSRAAENSRYAEANRQADRTRQIDAANARTMELRRGAARTVAAARMENEANADTASRQRSTPRAPTRGSVPTRPASDMTFKQAFAAARKAGKGTFMWNGKKYTTELAKPAPKAGSTPSRGTSGGVRGRGRK